MADNAKEVRKAELKLKIEQIRQEIENKQRELAETIKELSRIAPLTAADYAMGLR